MKALDYVKAFGVSVATLAITLAASYPMVAFYAYFIEPGHPQAFYVDAAQWIAPWSSYILGPIVYFAFNFWLARRKPGRNAMLFAAATIAFYVVIDWSMVSMMGIPLRTMLTAATLLSVVSKAAGALLGAHLGSRARS